jgi:CNT family concentrative nucleoside transporter
MVFQILFGLFGLAVLLGIAWVFSLDRKNVDWKLVATGVALQIGFASLVLLVPGGRLVFDWLGALFVKVLSFVAAGSTFIFGSLMDTSKFGFIFAFQVLPTIIFVAALFAILYHLGVMQVIVTLLARVMTRLMGASGAESLNAAAGVFMGQTEAPLTIRPYLNAMTRSELLCVMTSGMAHISAGIMGAYIFVGHVEPKLLLASVLMTSPGSILIAKILIPETGTPQTAGTVKLDVARSDANLVGAAARGTSEGLSLALNVAAMLISFLALIALVNVILGIFGLTLETILGYVFSPVALLIGVPFRDVRAVGSLLGLRMVANEFIAYTALGPLKPTLDPRSFTLATLALCGFANLSSIGIQIGGIGALAPNRRHDLARLGLRAMFAGTLANFMTATIAGFLL